MADRQHKTAPGQFFAALDVAVPGRPVKVGRRNRLVTDLIEEAHLLINTAKSIRAFDAKGNVWDVLAQLEDVMSATCRRTTELVAEIDRAVAVEQADHQSDPQAEDLGDGSEPWEDTVADAIKGAKQAIQIASDLRALSATGGWALRHLLLPTDPQVAKAVWRAADAAANPAFVRPVVPAPEPSQYQRSLQDRINERVVLGFDGARDTSNLSVARVRAGNDFLYFMPAGDHEATAPSLDALVKASFRAHPARLVSAVDELEDAPVKSAEGQDLPVQVNASSVSPSPADMPRRTPQGGRRQGRVR